MEVDEGSRSATPSNVGASASAKKKKPQQEEEMRASFVSLHVDVV